MVASSGEKISGQSINANGTDVAIFIPHDVTDVTIEDNAIYGATMAGVYADGGATGLPSATGITVTDNTIYQIAPIPLRVPLRQMGFSMGSAYSLPTTLPAA